MVEWESVVGDGVDVCHDFFEYLVKGVPSIARWTIGLLTFFFLFFLNGIWVGGS